MKGTCFLFLFCSLLTCAITSTKAEETLKVTTIMSEPYLMLRETHGGEPLVGNDRYEGFIADVVQMLCEKMGVDYALVQVKDHRYGSMYENGSWNGMVGEVIRQEADMAAAPLTITSMRSRVIDFSKPFMATGIGIAIKKPQLSHSLGEGHAKLRVRAFFAPFKWEVWVVFIVAYVVVSLLFCILGRLVRGTAWQNQAKARSDGVVTSLADSCWWALRSAFLQGSSAGDRWPRSLSRRILAASWMMFVWITILLYAISFWHQYGRKSTGTPPPTIQSADDLARQTEIKYGAVDGGSTKDFFRSSKIAVYERMWNFMKSTEPSVFVDGTEQGIQRVRESDGKYAFLAESATIDYMSQKQPCDIIRVGRNLDSKGYGLAFPLGSKHKDAANVALLEMREDGTLQKLHMKWWYEKGECGEYVASPAGGQTAQWPSSPPVGMDWYLCPVILLIIGILVTIVTAVVEIFFSKNKDRDMKAESI